MRLLIYAFKPYGPYRNNISEQLIQALPGHQNIQKRVFKVEFDYQMFYSAFEELSPDIIIGMGQHPRARKIRIERKASNTMKRADGTIQAIKVGAPLARFSNVKLANTPITTVTYNAGTYVCNYSMYVMGEYSLATGTRFGFLHLPMGMGIEPMKNYISNCCDRLQDLD